MKNYQIGQIEIPIDYFNMSQEDKDELAQELIDAMLHILDKHLRTNLDRIEVLDLLIESSIITNQEDEKYEICQFLVDVRKILYEQTN